MILSEGFPNGSGRRSPLRYVGAFEVLRDKGLDVTRQTNQAVMIVRGKLTSSINDLYWRRFYRPILECLYLWTISVEAPKTTECPVPVGLHGNQTPICFSPRLLTLLSAMHLLSVDQDVVHLLWRRGGPRSGHPRQVPSNRWSFRRSWTFAFSWKTSAYSR